MICMAVLRQFALFASLLPGVLLRTIITFMLSPMPPYCRRAALLTVLLAGLGGIAWAQNSNLVLTIRNHQFVPPELTIPANTKVELLVRNEQQVPAEFESNALHREKIVPPGGQISVFVGPLSPGRYEFFDDFNQATRGVLVVK
jgi:hypothetical protein